MPPRDIPPNVLDNMVEVNVNPNATTTLEQIATERERQLELIERREIEEAAIALLAELNNAFPDAPPDPIQVVEEDDDDDDETLPPPESLQSDESLDWMDE